MSQPITELLVAWGDGDEAALAELTPVVYAELKRQARRHRARERPGHTLQATALVNEVYLRLIDIRRVQWQDRTHFLAMCARLMRRVLVDSARSRGYQKRGAGAKPVSLEEGLLVDDRRADLVALDDALEAFAAVDQRKSRVVELKIFGGLTVEEIAHELALSPETVMRDWKLAKAWLTRELRREG